MALVVYRFFYVYTKHITIARSDSWWSWEISAPKNAWAKHMLSTAWWNGSNLALIKWIIIILLTVT